MDDLRKDHIDLEGPNLRNLPKQLQTHNLPPDNVENINSTSKEKKSTNKPRVAPRGEEKMPQRIQRHSRVTLHRSAHPKLDQDQTEKSSYGLDWQQKGIWYGPTKVDKKMHSRIQKK